MSAKTAHEFISFPFNYYTNNRFDHRFGRNPNWLAFGLKNGVHTDAEIDLAIRLIADDFNLVMISDYLQESLILLKHDFCLSYEEISSLPKNIAINKHSINKSVNIDKGSKKLFSTTRFLFPPERMLFAK